jgi:hypothetical protein
MNPLDSVSALLTQHQLEDEAGAHVGPVDHTGNKFV